MKTYWYWTECKIVRTPHRMTTNLNMISMSMAITSLRSAVVHIAMLTQNIQECQLYYRTHLWHGQELPVPWTQLSLSRHNENIMPIFCFMQSTFQDKLWPFTSLLLYLKKKKYIYLNKSLRICFAQDSVIFCINYILL